MGENFQRYSIKESLQRILFSLLGRSFENDSPETLSGIQYSEDESYSQIAELLQESLPGESLHFPDTIIGDSSDYVQISSEGIQLFGNATVYDDLRVPVSAVRVGASAPPDFATFIGSISILLFSPTSDEQIYFAAQMPHTRKQYTNIHPHVHFCPTTAGTGTVRWGLEYAWSNVNGAYPTGTTTIYASKETNETANQHLIAPFATLTGSSYGLSSMILCRLFRDADHSGDTYPADAALLEIDFHYEVDTMGSREEYTK